MQPALPYAVTARTVERRNPVKTLRELSYESDTLTAQYCDAHYGEEHFGVPNAPAACARVCLELMEGRTKGHALDLGCALGRSSFELARGGFRRVTGLDFSRSFWCLASRLREEGTLRYSLVEEGEIVSFREISLADLGLDHVRQRVEFHRADACDLSDLFTGCDLVLAANLIDRLHSPRRFLSTIQERMNPGGILVISSPYTWLEEFTKKEEWLGGYHEGGEPVWTLDGLREALAPHFRLLGEPRPLPFVIRETRRKFQHGVAELTAWELL
jgi:putative 4-mercaptohistidine N1-methyltranferase